MDYTYFFYILLFSLSFLYAAVGHGGASGYLALMAIFSVAPDVMKPTALLLNIFVSFTAFIQFYRGHHFKWNLFLPFAITSVPMAYWCGLMTMEFQDYKRILGVLLLLPIFRFLFFSNTSDTELKPSNTIISLIIGAIIGILSGLIGIGGGIILSPVLLLLKWTNQKQTAAISALFIFVNSFAGLAGQMKKGIHFTNDMFLFVVIAFIGGLTGSYLGAMKFNQQWLKHILAMVLLFASFKLLFTKA